MAVWRGFPWRKVPGYFLCQLLGAICGAAIVYGNYKTAISIKEGGNHIRTLATAGYFGTVPVSYRSLECVSLNCSFDSDDPISVGLYDERGLFLRRIHRHSSSPFRHTFALGSTKRAYAWTGVRRDLHHLRRYRSMFRNADRFEDLVFI